MNKIILLVNNRFLACIANYTGLKCCCLLLLFHLPKIAVVNGKLEKRIFLRIVFVLLKKRALTSNLDDFFVSWQTKRWKVNLILFLPLYCIVHTKKKETKNTAATLFYLFSTLFVLTYCVRAFVICFIWNWFAMK